MPSQNGHCWSDDRQGLIPGVSSNSSTEPQKYTHHERERESILQQITNLEEGLMVLVPCLMWVEV